MTRRELLSEAVGKCMKELYSYAYPKVEWKNFKQQCKKYTKKYKEWEKMNPDSRPKVDEYCGPRPYEFYFLPKDMMKDICDSYVQAYKMNDKEQFESSISILLDYCMDPIRDKYIEEQIDENGFKHPGYRSYEHFESITEALNKVITEHRGIDSAEIAEEVWNKVKDYFGEAENFYNWTSELNSFNMNVYLGASPCSNKNTVVDNWKKYRNTDIEIDESKIIKEYYGDE